MRFIMCSAKRCYKRIDPEEALQFKENLFLIESQQSLKEIEVTCKFCNKITLIQCTDASKIEYWKCLDCNKFFCYKHNDENTKCMCFCNKCMEVMNTNEMQNHRWCAKCDRHMCFKCNTNYKSKDTPACDCKPIVRLKEQDIPLDTLLEKSNCNPCCDYCDDALEAPKIPKFGCGHSICEFCIFVNIINNS